MVCIPAVSQTPRCAPRSQMFNFSPKKTLHHNAKSISAVCITPLCPSPKDEVCIIESNSKSSLVTVVAFKETNRRNPFRGEHIYILKEKIWSIIWWFTILTPRCHAHHGVRIFPLYDQICLRNRNRIRIKYSVFIRSPNGFESWKNGGRKSRDTLPLSPYA